MNPTLLEHKKVFVASPILPGTVRVRIAPSPTGTLHLGTARSALFNFLFAQKYNGVFVLRIEDTDVARSRPAFEKDIIEGLQWLGVTWNEGIDVGGQYAPYRQSERTYIYAKYLNRLLDENKAYWCFCTPAELEQARQKQQKAEMPQRYSGRCASLSYEAIRNNQAVGKPGIIRLRVPARDIVFDDLIRGSIRFQTELMGDIAIAKNPSVPLYNLAAAVDDYEMAITHVLRGEDHIANTPKQMVIAEALAWTSPQFGHFPLILGSDRAKLSKRHGATSVQELRSQGYFPEAVVNFLALLGWNPGDNRELFSITELIEAFSLGGIQHGGAIWNQQKLEWFNKQFLKHAEKRWLTVEKDIPDELMQRIKQLVEQTHGVAYDNYATTKSAAIACLALERLGVRDLDKQFFAEFGFFFRRPPLNLKLLPWKRMSIAEVRKILSMAKSLLETIPEGEWSEERLGLTLFEKAKELGDRGVLLWPLRVALSGQKDSPGPHEIAAILGKQETIDRITKAIDAI